MREIKFRGRSLIDEFELIKKGSWIYGGITFDSDRVWIDVTYFGQIIVDKETIGQYTGLKDINGKEIYEGDIVELDLENEKIIGLVDYSNSYTQYIITKTKNIVVEDEALGDYAGYVKVIRKCI